MATRQFFTERRNIHLGSSVKLPDTEAEHIRKSLRMLPGDPLVLFNGEQKFLAKLTRVTKDNVLAEVTQVLDVDASAPTKQITLLQGLIRAANFELVIQKATELGVENIIPLQTEFSQVKLERMETKQARWEKIALEACKQSERNDIPSIYPALHFAEIGEKEILNEFDLVLFLAVPREIVTKIAEVRELGSYATEINQAKRIAILVGPEGGFSPTEHQIAREWGIPFVSMGTTILKAETAAIAAVAFVKFCQQTG